MSLSKLAGRESRAAGTPVNTAVGFASPNLLDVLERMTASDCDKLPFGVIGLEADGTVAVYNTEEGKLAGLSPARVIGRHFFTSVAPCINNSMVAHPLQAASEIDSILDYVYMFRLSPVEVRLRLLKRRGGKLMYLLSERRD
jgi:photoactive yellow protein